MINRYLAPLAALLALAFSPPAAAQQELKLKAGKVWKHKHSDIAVPYVLGGIARSSGSMFAADELDVSVAFDTPDGTEALTVYVFRNTNGAVPVWFAQAQRAIENRSLYGSPALHVAPQAFMPPGQTSTSGLRAIYATAGGTFRSTGVMLLPVGDWYVKIRASSQSRSADELAQWMEGVLSQIAWPKTVAAAAAATPVTACATPLAFPVAASDAPKDGAADLLGGMLGMMASDKEAKSADDAATVQDNVQWCRDVQMPGNQAVYRRNQDANAYLLAVGDNGNGIWVGPDASAALLASGEPDAPAPSRFSIMLSMAAQNVSFVAQDRLPSPERVMEIVRAGRSTSSVTTWGKGTQLRINTGGN